LILQAFIELPEAAHGSPPAICQQRLGVDRGKQGEMSRKGQLALAFLYNLAFDAKTVCDQSPTQTRAKNFLIWAGQNWGE
jgi:hypothetical protein